MSNLHRALLISSMLMLGVAPVGARRLVALPAAGVTAESAPAAAPAAEAAPDHEGDLYNEGTTAVNAGQWQQAREAFDQVLQLHGAHADGALYWSAYALNKLGRRDDALGSLTRLESAYPQSQWIKDGRALEVEIRQSMGQAVSPDKVSDEDLKLIALNGLMNSDPERALPLLEKILQSDQRERVKDHALFVLAQSGSPQAHAVILSIARGNADRKLQRKALDDVALFGGKQGREELAQLYATSDDVEVKKSILRGYMVSGDKERVLAAAKNEKNPELRREAVHQLGVMGGGNELWDMYQNEPSQDIKREIIQALFLAGQKDRLVGLAQSEKDDALRRQAIRCLGLMGPSTADALTALYQNEKSPDIRKEIMNAFFLQNNAKALVNIARNESDPQLRKAALEKLSLMHSKDAADYMMEILNK